MFQSIRPYALEAGLDDPVVCYQGAVVAEPESGRWLRHVPIPLELASPDVTKASGLDFLAPRVGFSRERTIAFGDGENDVELLEWAGYAVAVANAHERVLAAADFVCPSVDEEGVAQVVEAFLDSRR